MTPSLLVTGGAGFIGSHFVEAARVRWPDARIVVLDALTYAGDLRNLAALTGDPRYVFLRGDVAEPDDVARAFDAAGPGVVVVHLAAESHVDRSIAGAAPFVRTNVVGTQVMLDAARAHGASRFVHVSTDEVYGPQERPLRAAEDAPLRPSSPYAASKAGADLLVLAAAHTHGFPVVVTRCTNNFGPRQYAEKLVPVLVERAVAGQQLPIYGDGLQVRDWLHVGDHCDALLRVVEGGRPGAVYNIGAGQERTNLEIARLVLQALDRPASLISHVPDRPGHDRRYAVDTTRIEQELGWRPRAPFEAAFRATVEGLAAGTRGVAS